MRRISASVSALSPPFEKTADKPSIACRFQAPTRFG